MIIKVNKLMYNTKYIKNCINEQLNNLSYFIKIFQI